MLFNFCDLSIYITQIYIYICIYINVCMCTYSYAYHMLYQKKYWTYHAKSVRLWWCQRKFVYVLMSWTSVFQLIFSVISIAKVKKIINHSTCIVYGKLQAIKISGNTKSSCKLSQCWSLVSSWPNDINKLGLN